MKTRLYKKNLIIDLRKENTAHNWAVYGIEKAHFKSLKEAKLFIITQKPEKSK